MKGIFTVILYCILPSFLFGQNGVDSVEVNFTSPPGTVIFNSKASTHKYIGSPSITVLEDGTYIASHDYFGSFLSDTFVYESKNKGNTWNRVAEIEQLNWSKLFVHNKELYLFGVRPKGNSGYGDCVVMKSLDGGRTWTSPIDKKSGLLLEGFYHTAPIQLIYSKGRIWKAMEDHKQVDGWGNFHAFVMSADEESDLLDADSWTLSNQMKFDKSYLDGASSWLEGNMVIAKDKSLKNVLRVHYPLDDKAAIIDISDDGKTISFDPSTGIIELPGASKKFNILYDDKSNRYWTLSNYVLDADRSGYNERTRNTITLSYSDDLRHWHIQDTLLHHPDVKNHGFQYLDWLIEGNDIIAVSRTAWEDETGSADNQHNANYMTFHRFLNFREAKK